MEPIVPLKEKSREPIEAPLVIPPPKEDQQQYTFRPLSWEEADDLQEKHGKNVVASEEASSWFRVLLRSLVHPFNAILVILAIIAGATKDFRTMAVMLLMVVISAGIRFYQEWKAVRAIQNLKSLIHTQCSVLRLYRSPIDRDPTWDDVARMNTIVEQEIPMEDVALGDIIKLSAGDMVPADMELLESKDLFISEAALTGEALPVEKSHLKPIDDSSKAKICFMGTNVVSGTAKGVVTAIGAKTMLGELAVTLKQRRQPTAFEKGVKRVSYMFMGIMAVMLPTVLILSGLVQKNWLKAFLFTIAVAVGLTPEMLPMIVNANLAKGAYVMQKKRVIVKKMGSIIDLGGMDILCTDKTGTLTMNEVTVMKYLDLTGEVSRNRFPIELAFLNSHFQTGLKNLLDAAVVKYFRDLAPNANLVAKYSKIDEIPFDFVRRRMTVILEESGSSTTVPLRAITKGAVDEVLSICTHASFPTTSTDTLHRPIVPADIALARKLVDTMNQEGLRVVAVAYKDIPRNKAGKFQVSDECDMTFVGFVAFLDPPKPTTAPAIEALLRQGVTVKVLTGDSPVVCSKICRDVGIPIDRVVTTDDLRGQSDEEIANLAESGSIFARLTPIEKSKIVKGLRSRGHVVGFLGDGINDTAALKAADVGISVDTAVDVAKDAADLIMLEKDLMALSLGVREGRITYGNTIKYIKMAVSSNFGNVFSVLVASAWLKFLPILPVHIVVQNLLYDTSQIAIPWDTMDEEFLLKPRNWSVKSILLFMVCIGPVSCVFDIATFLFMYYYYDIQTNSDNVRIFQTAWFVESLLTQTLIVHMIRTHKIPFIQSRASLPLLCGTILIMAIGVALPFSPLRGFLKMSLLPKMFYPFLVGMLIGYCLLVNVVKWIYISVFHHWL